MSSEEGSTQPDRGLPANNRLRLTVEIQALADGYRQAPDGRVELLFGLLDSLPAPSKVLETATKKFPSWDRKTGKLWFAGKMIREFRPRKVAANVHAILNRFEENEWRDINVPEGWLQKTLDDTVTSLNRKPMPIRFSRRWESGIVTWEELSDPPITSESPPSDLR